VYPTIRRYPVVLAFIARHVLKGAAEGARDGYRTTRSELGELVPPHAIDAALRDFRTEGRRMAATVRAVDLVESKLRGELPHRDGRGDRVPTRGLRVRCQIGIHAVPLSWHLATANHTGQH
jgi:hypothetical protein